MTKVVKRVLGVFAALIIVGLISALIFWRYTKTLSPESTVEHNFKDAHISVTYSRPSKRKREIFGTLVPYEEVWRTGANEPTTFSTDKDLNIDGSVLKAGTYTLWTIPKPKSWKIIFNGHDYAWGINLDGSASREPEYDVLTLEVPIQPLPKTIKKFSIYFQNANNFTIMSLAWDKVAVAIPIKL